MDTKMECIVCWQELGVNCPSRSACVPRGHVYCLKCLVRLLPGNCLLCQRFFNPDQIIRLYLPGTAGPTDTTTGNTIATESLNDEDGDEIAFSEEECQDAEALATKLRRLGVNVEIEELVLVLPEVTDWLTRVNMLKGLDAQIAVTRLLMSVELLYAGAKKILSSRPYAGVRALRREIEEVRFAQTTLRTAHALCELRSEQVIRGLERDLDKLRKALDKAKSMNEDILLGCAVILFGVFFYYVMAPFLRWAVSFARAHFLFAGCCLLAGYGMYSDHRSRTRASR